MKKDIQLSEGTIPISQQLRVASLNLLHSNTLLEERYQMLHSEVHKLQPDILHIQEANFAGHKDYIHDFMEKHGYIYSAMTPSSLMKSVDRASSNLTLIKQPATFKVLDEIIDDRFESPVIQTLMATTEFNGIPVVTFNVHLAWGTRQEVRIKQIFQIETEVNNLIASIPNAIFIIAGDFNEEDRGDTVRFLYGDTAYQNYSTLWVDAWKHSGDADSYITSETKGRLAIETANAVGIEYPSLIPSRRIDYIFIRGWAYGRNGSPLRFNRWADSYVDGVSISDHYGVFVDLLVKN